MIDDTLEKALAENEPINWLFGRVLRETAERHEKHYLLEVLRNNQTFVLKSWNAWIAEFRSLLLNPNDAVRKVDAELKGAPANRIDSFICEVWAAIHLSRLGIKDFEVVLASGKKQMVDFRAKRGEKPVRVEVKHLHEPEDIIRTVAIARWQERKRDFPDRFKFVATLDHSHHGSLSDAGISRLQTVVDQLPDTAKDTYSVELEPGIWVNVRKFNHDHLANVPGPEGEYLRQVVHDANNPHLIVQSGIREEHFDFDLPELQGLFTKAFRVVGESVGQLFGRQSDLQSENIIVMLWDPPKFMWNPSTPERVEEALQQAFSSVGLNLTVLIFPQAPAPDKKYPSSGSDAA